MRTARKIRGRWLSLALVGILATGGGIYFARDSHAPSVGTNRAHHAATPVSPFAAGQRIFVSRCVACHQLNGRGLPSVYPPLAGSEWVNGTDDRIIRIVLNGLNGPTEVKGEKFNNLMPPFRELLDDEQIAQVLTYIRREWGNSAEPVAQEKVAAIRKSIAGRSAAWTAEELLQLP